MPRSAKTEYACLAMLELAQRYTAGKPVRVRAIAERHAIPSQFLVQILLRLKSAGLVASTRGAGGGYRLVRSPDDIALADIVEAIEGGTAEREEAKNSLSRTVLTEAFCEAAEAEWRALEAVSLAELNWRAAEAREAMYYI